jgi:hypothetical protein
VRGREPVRAVEGAPVALVTNACEGCAASAAFERAPGPLAVHLHHRAACRGDASPPCLHADLVRVMGRARVRAKG